MRVLTWLLYTEIQQFVRYARSFRDHQESSDTPAAAGSLGLNSKLVAISGHTVYYQQVTAEGHTRMRTLFKARMSAEANLLPHVAHGIGPPDLAPVLQEEIDFDL